jgi:hypothetical protein
MAGTRQVFDSQDEAVRRGRDLAQHERSELVIHGKDGQIRETNSCGHHRRDIRG